jgi:hypothetical protein
MYAIESPRSTLKEKRGIGEYFLIKKENVVELYFE